LKTNSKASYGVNEVNCYHCLSLYDDDINFSQDEYFSSQQTSSCNLRFGAFLVDGSVCRR
jgi:hypothetical protein